MKKNYLMMAAFATALAFTACSSEEEIPAAGSENGTMGLTEDVIEIAISNTGVGSTRVARPVGSSQAGNNVNKVVLHFYSSTDGSSWTKASGISLTKVDGDYTVSDMTLSYTGTESALGTPGDVDRQEKVAKIKVSGLSATAKKYRIVAEGYNTSFPYATASEESIKGLFKTSGNSAKGTFEREEVFAGYKDVDIVVTGQEGKNQSVKFASSVSIELTRQVAGMLGYFKNVPAYISSETYGSEIEGYEGKWAKVTKIVVKANKKAEGFQFPNTLLASNESYNGVKGDGYDNGEDLLTFEFTSENTSNLSTVKPGDTYTFSKDGKSYLTATGYTAPESFVALNNTLFGGCYILPYSEHATDAGAVTLSVIFYDESANVLATKNVTTNNFASPQTKTNYDILCNNFYSIGKKLKVDSAPETGGDDEDKPIDLSSTDEITVLINDAWEVIHDMGLE
ncbi:hypothetical protein Q3C19_08720 [Bacteroides sp. ET489]|uniref:hypothetical protein n=1 Tax=Bacteroides sp. ET489 TaxID=3057126 RepID=UPI002673E684|nr:hypothetical protein [Bacteroides sp. ET489]MDO3390558.1 hypothetical protein [Bacteroides sp. ET489]